MPSQSGDPLSGVKVLDLADASGAYCGRLLADLGADVLLVEPLEGLPSRRQEPLVEYDGRTISCFDRFVNLNKRSVALALDRPESRSLLLELVAGADLLIETIVGERPSWHGLADADLRAANPHLIRVQITAFGATGPFAAFESDDLVTLAAGGLLSLGGYEESGPIAVHGEQTYFARSIFAAAGALLALLERDRTGEARDVEVCAQEVIANALEDALPDYDLNGRVRRRRGVRPREAGTGTFRCADGYVALVAGRLGTLRAFASLLEWIRESDTEGAFVFDGECWGDHGYRQSDEGIAMFTEVFERFCATRTKAELYREGQRRQIAIAPVNSPAEVLADPQLVARGFFSAVSDRSGPVLVYPGRPYSIDGMDPLLRRPVPDVGEHNREILATKWQASGAT